MAQPKTFNHLRMAAAFAAEATRLMGKPPEWAGGLSQAEIEHYVAQSIVRLVRAGRAMGLVLPSFEMTAKVAPEVSERLPRTRPVPPPRGRPPADRGSGPR